MHIIWHILPQHASDSTSTSCHVRDLQRVLYLPAEQYFSSLSVHTLCVSVSHFSLLKWETPTFISLGFWPQYIHMWIQWTTEFTQKCSSRSCWEKSVTNMNALLAGWHSCCSNLQPGPEWRSLCISSSTYTENNNGESRPHWRTPACTVKKNESSDLPHLTAATQHWNQVRIITINCIVRYWWKNKCLSIRGVKRA